MVQAEAQGQQAPTAELGQGRVQWQAVWGGAGAGSGSGMQWEVAVLQVAAAGRGRVQ